tara:strand:- start:4932 stop:5171 length:240 start_codon:yes stop_codon:yes gene_type:complete
MSGMNPIVVGLVSSLVAIAAYMIDLKLNNEECNKNKLIKVGLLGLMIGISNLLLFSLLQVSSSNISISGQDILTGNPDF